jgi:hypothetical protein
MMQQRVQPPDIDTVLTRYETVTREAMIQLARSASDKGEWRAEREEMQRALKRASSTDVQLLTIPLQATLQRAIGRIDRVLAATRAES